VTPREILDDVDAAAVELASSDRKVLGGGLVLVVVLLFFLPTVALLLAMLVFCFGAIAHVRREHRDRLDMLEAEASIAAWRADR
jgi:hypothetical protein